MGLLAANAFAGSVYHPNCLVKLDIQLEEEWTDWSYSESSSSSDGSDSDSDCSDRKSWKKVGEEKVCRSFKKVLIDKGYKVLSEDSSLPDQYLQMTVQRVEDQKKWIFSLEHVNGNVKYQELRDLRSPYIKYLNETVRLDLPKCISSSDN
jgi:hypothetical protein